MAERNDIRIASRDHRDLFCRVFIETHIGYDPRRLAWPELGEDGAARLRALPFWNEAVSTEGNTAAKVKALAAIEPDPVIREAIALQGYEEERHSELLRIMTSQYRIPVDAQADDPLPKNLEWGFVRTEYGECFDSFFAFGLFAIAGDSGFFPPKLVAVFEPIVQEEARHILFFANWIAYRRKNLPPPLRPAHALRSGIALLLQAWRRIETARGVQTGDFAMKGHEAINTSISPRSFVDLCLRENERRLGLYDERLLRPNLVPTIARMIRPLLP